MRAAVWLGPNRIELREVPAPRPGAGEVLVRTGAVGVCGSDLHIYHGAFAPAVPPMIPGHEAAGIVAALGLGGAGLEEGRRVVVDAGLSCGHCFFCRRGSYYQCDDRRTLGMSGIDGAYADYFVAPAANCHPMPDSLSWEEASFADTLACPVNAMNRLPQRFGETVAVLGPGPGGLCFVQLARMRGAQRIFLVGTRRDRLELGGRYGADVLIHSREEDPVARILAETAGRGADLTIEACGVGEAVRQAFAITRKQGSVLIYGVFDKPVDGLDFQDMHRRELTIYGASGAPWSYPAAVDLIAGGRVRVREMVTHTFRLEEIERALAVAESREGGYIKGVVLP